MKQWVNLLLMAILLFAGCSENRETAEMRSSNSSCAEACGETTACTEAGDCAENPGIKTASDTREKTRVTFVELGSVNCIPCKKMQPVMKAMEEKYGDQIRVVFHDVWQPDQKHFARDYGIKLIPTQVFLDENGNEFHRHEGFYPAAEIDKLLQARGLEVKNRGGE